MNDVLQAVGEELRQARRAAGLSLRDLPARSHDAFKPSAVGGYERGERSISVQRFCQLCNLYGAYPGEILGKALIRRSFLGSVSVDVERLNKMNQREAHILLDLVQRVQRHRGVTNHESLVIRGADIEVAAQSAELPADALIERLGSAVSILS